MSTKVHTYQFEPYITRVSTQIKGHIDLRQAHAQARSLTGSCTFVSFSLKYFYRPSVSVPVRPSVIPSVRPPYYPSVRFIGVSILFGIIRVDKEWQVMSQHAIF